MIKEAVTHYDEFALQYEKNVYSKVKKELAQAVLQKLFIPFDI